MAIEDISGFITEIAVHYAPPKYSTANERDAWLRSIHTALKGSSPAVLARAAQIIIDGRKNRYFPLVADLREAIREAAEQIRFDQHVQTLPELRQLLGNEWSAERVKLAYDLIHCAMGKEAASANPSWILALWNFCRRFQRLPDNRKYEARTRLEREDYGGLSELEFCKRSARDFDEAYERSMQGTAGELSARIHQLGAAMLAKREKLRAEVLGR